MRTPRRHRTDQRRHHPSPRTPGRSGRTDHTDHTRHTDQPSTDRVADAILLLWDLR